MEEIVHGIFQISNLHGNEKKKTVYTKTMRSINNKPGWWAVYIVYCMIPVVIYCWYLWQRTKEVSMLFHTPKEQCIS